MRFEDRNMLLSGARAAQLYKGSIPAAYVLRGSRELVRALAADRPYQDPAEIWILQDPEVQALMRRAGVEERFITGDGSDFEKFRFFCTVLQNTVGNTVKLRVHAVLQMLFDCELTLCDTHCEEIWRITCEVLREQNITPRDLVKRCGGDTLLAEAYPWEDLADFVPVRDVRALPVFCPDAYFLPQERTFAARVRALGKDAADWAGFCRALTASVARFMQHGCRVARHGVLPTRFLRPDEYHAAQTFQRAMAGEVLTEEELALYQAQLWRVLGREYVKCSVALEIPVSASAPIKQPINGTVMGVISPKENRALFDYLQGYQGLPRVALYAAEPQALRAAAALAACYPAAGEGAPQISLGILYGSPAENRARMQAFADVAPLSHFLGVIADPASTPAPVDALLLHRTLCTLLAEWEERGETDADTARLCALLARAAGDAARELLQI